MFNLGVNKGGSFILVVGLVNVFALLPFFFWFGQSVIFMERIGTIDPKKWETRSFLDSIELA